MTDATAFDSWRGHTLRDRDGEKVGRIDEIYANDQTGQPEWLTVDTGMFGSRTSFVPLRGSTAAGEDLQVPYSKDQIKSATNIDSTGHIEPDQVSDLYGHYALDVDESTRRGRPAEAAPQPAGMPGEPGTQAAAMPGEAGTRSAAMPGEAGTRSAGMPGEAGTQGAAMPGEAGATDGMGAIDRDAFLTRSEEEIHVGTESVETGRARLHKTVVTEDEQVTVPVSHEEAHLEREPITEAEAEAMQTRPTFAEEDREIVLHEERPIVSKMTVPKERVRLATDKITEEKVVRDQLRKERVEVEGLDEKPQR